MVLFLLKLASIKLVWVGVGSSFDVGLDFGSYVGLGSNFKSFVVFGSVTDSDSGSEVG